MRIFISAGEVSGEHHGARLVEALQRKRDDLEFDCMGGPILAATGARLIYPLSDLAVLGFAAVFKSLLSFVKVLADYTRYLDAEKPDLVVLIDYPGLHLRFATLAHRRGIPVVYYVCPQLWAWAPWRAARFSRVVDHALTILPFEEEYFRRKGIESVYVGHPAADDLAGKDVQSDDSELENRVRSGRPGIALLPGSRPQEARANLPLMLDVAQNLQTSHPDALFFLPQLRDDTSQICQEILAAHPTQSVSIVRSVSSVLSGARFALVASGTATFEVAFHGVPMVVVYKILRWHRFLGSQLLTVPWVSQVNLIAGKELVPEFVTADEPVQEIADASRLRIDDTPIREETIHALSESLKSAFSPGASDRAADEILRILVPKQTSAVAETQHQPS